MDKLRQFLAFKTSIPNQLLVNNNDDDEEEIDIDCDDRPQARAQEASQLPIGQMQRQILLKRIAATILVILGICLLILLAHLLSSDSGPEDEYLVPDFTSKTQVHFVHETERSLQVKNMTREAWNAYKKYAFGAGALSPVTNGPSNWNFGAKSGATILSAASTLYVMGLTEEFEQAREWIRKEFDFKKVDLSMTVGEVVNDLLGGLLSCYALTGDHMFLDKAHKLSQTLEPAYFTSSGLAYQTINPKRSEASGKWVWLSLAGGQQLEYKYLADITEDISVRVRHFHMRHFFKNLKLTTAGLYNEEVNVELGRFDTHSGTRKASMGYSGRQFYAGLIKAYIQSNTSDVESLEMYKKALDNIDENGMFEISRQNLTFIRYGENYLFHPKMMEYHACYVGAMLTLGANAMQAELDSRNHSDIEVVLKNITDSRRIARHRQLAIDLTETCHEASVKSKTGLAPYKFHFTISQNATNMLNDERYQVEFNLNPELAESYFILWRQTHDQKYRDYAWEMVEAIQKHCRTPSGGYSRIENVNQIPTVKSFDYQPPNFLGATLKYLYLTLVDDDGLLSLKEWVFSTAGQPLPIVNVNPAYQVKPGKLTHKIAKPPLTEK